MTKASETNPATPSAGEVAKGHVRKRVTTSVALGFCLTVLCWAQITSGEVLGQTEGIVLPGEDQYKTAVLVSQAGFAPGVQAVVVANGEDAQIASCAATLAAAYEAPLLLTRSDALDVGTRVEIARLEPKRIFLVGVEAEVGGAVARRFQDCAVAGRVVMVGGADASETARLVARLVGEKTGGSEGVVIVRRGEGASRASAAVAASSLAATKGWPLLFVDEGGPLPEQTSEIIAELGARSALTVQVSVEVSSGVRTIAVEGADQYEVSARLAEEAVALGMSYSHLVLAPGYEEGSLLGVVAGPYLARNGGILLLCGLDDLSREIVRVLARAAADARRVDFFGTSGVGEKRARLILDTGGVPEGVGVVTLKQSSKGEAVAWLEQKLSDLTYRPGPIDGVFDGRTRDAVIAFQKWEGLMRDGLAGPRVWWKLLAADRPVPRNPEEGVCIEINRSKQLLLYCVDGVVERTIPVSTGNASVGMVTPAGVYHINRENTYEGTTEWSPRYKPLYLRQFGALAIHGYWSVPHYPASHGCIRMTFANMDEFHHLAPVGTKVHIY